MNDTEALLARVPGWLSGGQPERVEHEMRLLCAREPERARAHFLRGVALHVLDRIDDALAAFERVLELDPHDVQALSARAGMLHRLGDAAGAERGYLAALAVRADDAEIVTNLARVREDLGRDEQALAGYGQALALRAHSPRALLNRAALLARLGRTDDAVQDCRALLHIAPDIAQAHASLANLLLAQTRFDAALDAAQAALRLDPQHARAQADCALALAALGRFDEYSAAARRADALQPGILQPPGDEDPGPRIPDARIVYLITATRRLARADWHDFERQGRVFAEVAHDPALHASLPDLMGLLFRSYYWPVPPAARVCIARRCAALVRARAVPRLWVGEPPREDARMRIGYLSGHFRQHPGATLMLPVLTHHDRRRFHVSAYVLNDDDGSAIRQRLLECADSIVHLGDADDHEAAWRIHRHGCDLLIYCDGYTHGTRPGILAQRPAPLQLTWRGYHGSMGEGLVDYHLTDPRSNPPQESTLWHEARLFLPHAALGFPHAEYTAPDPPPARAAAGLPAHGVVLAALHGAEKIDPELFACWMALLRALPDAVLWLLDGASGLVEALHRHACEHGVDPARLVFAPRLAPYAHLQRLAAADLWLDTRWCGSHTTMLDALACGVPAVTCPGNAVHGRIGRAILHAAGLPELVCGSLDDYRDLVLRLAQDPPARAALRAHLRRRDAPLFDTVGFTRAMERGYQQIWQRHLRGRPPCDTFVGAPA